MTAVRLQRVLASAGVASRRGADALIEAGRVRVDGRAAALGERVDPARQRIEVDGRAVGAAQAPVYLALSKPAGVTSTVADRHATTTVLDLVPDRLAGGTRLYPVGRLDRDSEGLLLLTNDGTFADRVLHPRYGVEREYAVGVRERLDRASLAALRRGAELSDGRAAVRSIRSASPDEVDELDRVFGARATGQATGLVWYRVVLGEGRKREIRRLFGVVGAVVERLVRVRIGPLVVDGMAPGSVRSLTAPEVAALLAASGGPSQPAGAGNVPKSGTDAANDPRRSAHPLVVALDGPGSSGKSTVGSAAAEYLGYRFCDTGMFYRAVTWLALERDVPTDDETALAALVPDVELAPEAEGRLSRVVVDGRDVTDKVASARVDRSVSDVARQPAVRAALLPRQRELAGGGGMLMAGRDIGTIVLPDADLKLFLDASPEERARRRAEQRGIEAGSVAGQRILEELRRRDRIDETRTVAPLRAADDAVVIETDGNTLGQTIDAVVEAIQRRERQVAKGASTPRRRS